MECTSLVYLFFKETFAEKTRGEPIMKIADY